MPRDGPRTETKANNNRPFVLVAEAESSDTAQQAESHLKRGDLEEDLQPEMRRRAHGVSRRVENYQPR